MKRFILFFVLIAFHLVSAEMRSSVSQWGITWTFDKSYECGRFVNGDWWVVGPVKVQSVSPVPSGGKHGSMINPTAPNQAYDSRTAYYQSSMLVTFPRTLQANQSLVSTISLTTSDCTSSSGPGYRDYAGTCLREGRSHHKTAAVLTCLSEAPPADAFRPGYCGDSKKIYTVSGLRTDRLPGLAPIHYTPDDLSGYERAMERVWLQHITDYQCRTLHPIDNMRNYHREIYTVTMDVSLLVLQDIPNISTLLYRFIQLGLDQYSMILTGHGDSAAEKWTVIFAGLMVDDPDIYNVFKQGRSKTPIRQDWQTYYAEDAESNIKSAIVPEGQCHTGYVVPAAGMNPGKVVMWRKDPGCKEHEHMDPSEWNNAAMEDCSSGGGSKNESYRTAAPASWPGMALAAKYLYAEEYWDHDEFFDYVDRWMTEDLNARSTYATFMWRFYRNSIPDPSGIMFGNLPAMDYHDVLPAGRLISIDGRAAGGANGVYIYQRTLQDGSTVLEKMIFVK